MSYLKHVLQPGERVITEGRLHWVIYTGAIAVAILGVILLALSSTMQGAHGFLQILAIIAFVIAVAWAGKAWFDQWTTEIAVTNLRVIYKTGFLRRRTAEMNMDKVESVVVRQSIIGRILGYGAVHVRGTGEGLEELERIGSPVALRNAIIAR